jgi:hypothetical protein
MVLVGRSTDQLLLGEWACLGILYTAPTHGFAIAARLKPEGDIGRVWSLSRALTYRSIDKLVARGYIRPVAEEPGSPAATAPSSPRREPDGSSSGGGSQRRSVTCVISAVNSSSS